MSKDKFPYKDGKAESKISEKYNLLKLYYILGIGRRNTRTKKSFALIAIVVLVIGILLSSIIPFVRPVNAAGLKSETDVYLIKTDKNGIWEWGKTFDRKWGDVGKSVQQTSDGGYIIVGSTISFGASWSDVYLIKTDKNGNEEWNKTFGGRLDDGSESVHQTSDGGYIIAGYTYSFGDGGKDVYLIKTDQDGNEEWSKTFGGIADDKGYSVQQTSDGGYIVVGYTEAEALAFKDVYLYLEDVYLIKTDKNGNEEWNKTFGGISGDKGYSVRQTFDGGYIIAGYTSSFGAGIYLIKTDKSGNEEWNKTFGGGLGDGSESVQQTSDGGYIIAGSTYSFGDGGKDVYLIKTDQDGNEEWNKTFGFIDYYDDIGYSVQLTSDGGYIIVGYMEFESRHVCLIIKTDKNGNIEWKNMFGKKGNNVGYSVQQTSDGGYIIVGYKESPTSKHVYPIKTDKNGNEDWSKTFGGKYNDSGNSVQQTSDGGYIIVGYTDSPTSRHVYLIKTDKNGNEEWSRIFGKEGSSVGFSVQQTSDWGYIIVGSTTNAGAWFFGITDLDVYLIKTDKNGNEEWNKTFSGIYKGRCERGYSVQQTSDGGYIITGYMETPTGKKVYLIKTDKNGKLKRSGAIGKDNSVGYSVQQTSDGSEYIIVGESYAPESGRDIYLLKVDNELHTVVWSRTFGGRDDDFSESVKETSDGGYIITGSTKSFGVMKSFGIVNSDVYLIKTDKNGNEDWSKTFGGKGNDRGFSLQEISDREYIIVGNTDSFGAGGSDVWIVKTTSPTARNSTGVAIFFLPIVGAIFKIMQDMRRRKKTGVIESWKAFILLIAYLVIAIWSFKLFFDALHFQTRDLQYLNVVNDSISIYTFSLSVITIIALGFFILKKKLVKSYSYLSIAFFLSYILFASFPPLYDVIKFIYWEYIVKILVSFSPFLVLNFVSLYIAKRYGDSLLIKGEEMKIPTTPTFPAELTRYYSDGGCPSVE